ncbi:MAG: TetR/AcrR family transcriptional regulator [Pseudomonadota bacterium]
MDKGGLATTRKPRADAVRNRMLLLATAKAVFAAKGSEASLDEIAQTAGVGPGTLYRHFPTRDALVTAVFRNETVQLVAAADDFARTKPPLEAFRAWLLLFFDFVATKHSMMELLNSILGGTDELKTETMSQIDGAVAKLVKGAIVGGDIRPDIEPKDLMLALAGAAKFSPASDREQTAKRLVDILIAGVQAKT